jgi:type IV pilus assembly protein PilA
MDKEKMKATPNREDGFTLIELLVVILIIGILAAIAIPVFLNQRQKGADASLTSDVKNVSLAQETAITGKTAGTFDKNKLNESVKSLSNGTIMGTWTTSKGYCVVGFNKNGTYQGIGSDQRTYLWFDSALGGYVLPPDASTPPTGGACANPRPPTNEQAWYYANGGWQ